MKPQVNKKQIKKAKYKYPWYKAGSYNPLTGTKLYTDEELLKLFENEK